MRRKKRCTHLRKSHLAPGVNNPIDIFKYLFSETAKTGLKERKQTMGSNYSLP